MVKRLVAHHELDQPAQHRIVGLGIERREGAHGDAFDQHLHADDLLVDLFSRHQIREDAGDRLAHGERRAPAAVDIAREACNMSCFLARLVGGVFLGAGVEQDVAETGRQRQRALLAMEQVGDRPVHDVVAQPDPLVLVQPVGHRAFQLDDRVQRHDGRFRHVERLIEVDVALVERVPEMVVGGRNDAVEGVRPPAIPRNLQHRRKIVASDRVIGLVVSDLLGHVRPPVPCSI